MTRTRRGVAGALGFLLALMTVVLTAAPASAHAVLTESDPASGALLQNAPDTITLTFNEPVSRVGDGITVIAPDGTVVSKGKASGGDGGHRLESRLKKDLPQGTFLVSYRLVSADGHPISGGYPFSIGRETKVPDAPKDTEDLVDPLVRGAMSVGRFAGYVGASLLAGSVLMLAVLWPRRIPVTMPKRMGWVGWWLLMGGTVLCLWAQVPYGFGGPLWSFDVDAWQETLTSTLGVALLARLVLLTAAVGLLHRALRGLELTRSTRFTLGAFGVATLFTWPFAGHAANSIGKYLSIPADAIHVGAMAVWLGGLVILATVTLGKNGANDDELDAILPTWSRWAFQAIGAVVFTGAIEALLEVGRLSALTSTRYGALVLAKIGGVVVIFAFAAFARRIVLRRLRTASSGGGLVRRIIIAEIVVAAVMLGVATTLTQTPPAASVNDAAVDKGSGFGAAIKNGELTIDFQLDPARRGANSLHLYSYTKSGGAAAVVEWKTTVALPSKDVAPISVPLIAIAENHASGELYLPTAGEWEFRITIRTSETDQITLKQLVDID